MSYFGVWKSLRKPSDFTIDAESTSGDYHGDTSRGHGEPPQQKYRLFAEYYRTIYKRETRRKLLGGILSERQKDIDTIHAQAGLLLQAAVEETTKELSKGTDIDSALSDEQFRALVKRRLEQIGIGSARVLAYLLD